ncbi:MAG: hypothetical protein R3F49_24710 [Planctomycetota bacterium]
MKLAAALLCLTATLGPEGAQRRYPVGAPHAGLPVPGATWAPYHADPEHPLNRVFRRAFLAELAPAVVGAALPSEAPNEPLAARWMLQWRDGTAADARLYGGDGRQLPRERFDEGEAAALAADLAALTDADVSALRARPALAVLFQHDLLRLVQRLADDGEDLALVPALLAAARRCALPREALLALPDALSSAASTLDSAAARAYLTRDNEFREVLRRSTRLFDASRTLLWSRLYLAHPAGLDATASLVDAARAGEAIEVPIGTRALLVQGIVAVDELGAPCATALVADLRLQTLANRAGLSAENPTTSRDGVDFSMLQLEREGLREQVDPIRPGEHGELVEGAREGHHARSAYRIVNDDDQDLFRDYGTLKHTTYRAQCTLCHRTTETPEPELGGFPVLRKHAEPRLAETGRERTTLAEQQLSAWLARVAAR